MDHADDALEHLWQLLVWMNSASTGYGAASANQTASIPRTGQIAGYSSLSSQGQQTIAARGANGRSFRRCKC